MSEPASSLTGNLRQMIAVLEAERQALAGLDADALTEVARDKEKLCDAIAPFGPEALDPQVRDLAEAARSLNEVNRRVRNLLAANITTRLEALGAARPAYRVRGATIA
ncbi:flagellar protein FlgN [Erythrobacter sp. KY5]|uniref:flagellar protein FlgN n=1 Tax=Erythrobacter sp. KY5 TaxID=2011159 RepID=UPI000DBF15A9|nr:flagellar protein FlgN [Erythrobacter sp. KY5]AWW73535.1 flagellar protein FlgN [Erythrobacter sp. KY5]